MNPTNPLCDPSGGTAGTGVNTALGCLAAGDPYLLVGQLLGWGTIVGAGIAFIMLLIGGGQVATAAGDPKKVQAAKELITAALSGAALIIFSVALFRLIGVDILGLG